MDSPFKVLAQAFCQQYQVHFSVINEDGNVLLSLSDQQGLVARRVISADQRQDPERLQNLIQSIRLGIAIDHGMSPRQLLHDTHLTPASH